MVRTRDVCWDRIRDPPSSLDDRLHTLGNRGYRDYVRWRRGGDIAMTHFAHLLVALLVSGFGYAFNEYRKENR